jgi:hypothetical protein
MQSLQTIGVASEFQTDWNGRDVTPAGKARPKETPRTLPDRPRKASAGVEINVHISHPQKKCRQS